MILAVGTAAPYQLSKSTSKLLGFQYRPVMNPRPQGLAIVRPCPIPGTPVDRCINVAERTRFKSCIPFTTQSNSTVWRKFTCSSSHSVSAAGSVTVHQRSSAYSRSLGGCDSSRIRARTLGSRILFKKGLDETGPVAPREYNRVLQGTLVPKRRFEVEA